MHKQTYYGWKQKFAGASGEDIQQLRALEQENARLKRALANAMLDNQILKEINAKNGRASGKAGGGSVGAWWAEQKIEVVHIRPGKPLENAHCESFNGRLREEFLNVTQFQHLWDAQAKTERWFQHYNWERPHSSLDYRTPQEFTRDYSALRAPQPLANPPSLQC